RAGKPIGAMLVHTCYTRVFSRAEETFLQVIANLTALALTNATDYERLKSYNKRQSDFISVASHELRTPLAHVPIHIQNMINGLYGPITDEQHDVLKGVVDSVRDEKHLIDNMLNLVRIQEGRSQAQPEIVSLSDLIIGMCEMLRMEAKAK